VLSGLSLNYVTSLLSLLTSASVEEHASSVLSDDNPIMECFAQVVSELVGIEPRGKRSGAVRFVHVNLQAPIVVHHMSPNATRLIHFHFLSLIQLSAENSF
jgi:hypothetical protein